MVGIFGNRRRIIRGFCCVTPLYGRLFMGRPNLHYGAHSLTVVGILIVIRKGDLLNCESISLILGKFTQRKQKSTGAMFTVSSLRLFVVLLSAFAMNL